VADTDGLTDAELVEELSELGNHPCRAGLDFGATLRQAASRITFLEAQLAEAKGALRLFVGAAYPVATEINQRGHNWSEAYLDQALPEGRAILSTEGSEG
jgi:hypothetical protein